MPAAKRSASRSTANGKVVIEAEQDRETKNAFRFAEVLAKGKDRGDIGSVYCLKSALEKAGIDPEEPIRVTIEQAPDED